jgi:hypothetical protein
MHRPNNSVLEKLLGCTSFGFHRHIIISSGINQHTVVRLGKLVLYLAIVMITVLFFINVVVLTTSILNIVGPFV